MTGRGSMAARANELCCKECGRPFTQQAENDGIVLTTTTIWHAGNFLRFTLRESELLEQLINAYPEPMLRERVFRNIWGTNSDVNDKILDVVLVKIRKRLPQIGLAIESVWGVGWRLKKL